MDKLVSLCKRRGFIFPSSEIYGGLGSCYDYGPLGVELKRNIKNFWWVEMTQKRDDVEGIDASILMSPSVWEASGHVTGFTDPMVDCRKCKARFRADALDEARCPEKPSRSPIENKCDLTEPRQFNLMFKTFMGPVEDSSAIIYLRPETAQGIYVNFHNVLQPSRQKVPFGIAQIGKAFRNEITPGNFIFRTREFEQMEMQFFIHPSEEEKWFEYWKEKRFQYYLDLGIREEKLRIHEHAENELAHYAKRAIDIEYEYPFGWKELEGVHDRTDYDLSHHQEHSGRDLRYFDQERNEKYLPYIIETSAGCDRSLLTVLVDAYREEEVKGETRVLLSLSPKVAPIKVAVLPLVRKDGMPEIAKAIYKTLSKHFKCFYDEAGAVGRRYRRQDEAGTPFGVTVDGQTKEDETVTLRDRDTMDQTRVKISDLVKVLTEKVGV